MWFQLKVWRGSRVPAFPQCGHGITSVVLVIVIAPLVAHAGARLAVVVHAVADRGALHGIAVQASAAVGAARSFGVRGFVHWPPN